MPFELADDGPAYASTFPDLLKCWLRFWLYSAVGVASARRRFDTGGVHALFLFNTDCVP